MPKIKTDRDRPTVSSSPAVSRMPRRRRFKKPAWTAAPVMAVIPFSSSEKAWAADQNRTRMERGSTGKTLSYTWDRITRNRLPTPKGRMPSKRDSKAASEMPMQGNREAARAAMGNRERNI